MPNLKLVAACNKLAAIPKTSRWLNGEQIYHRGNYAHRPARNIINQPKPIDVQSFHTQKKLCPFFKLQKQRKIAHNAGMRKG